MLGQGGFGITYLAHDTNLNKHVAIKEFLPVAARGTDLPGDARRNCWNVVGNACTE